MDDEELFVNIDLNDDNICSVCKLETETGTLSFCHVCFELSIEGKKLDWGGNFACLLIWHHTSDAGSYISKLMNTLMCIRIGFWIKMYLRLH